MGIIAITSPHYHLNHRHPKQQIEASTTLTIVYFALMVTNFTEIPEPLGFLFLLQELQNHLETCECFPVKCPNKCEAVISREMVGNIILVLDLWSCFPPFLCKKLS